MPELPEVETIRRQLDPSLRGSRITNAWTFGTAKFEQALSATGLVIGAVRRRGKYLILELTEEDPTSQQSGTTPTTTVRELIVHLGMTGRLGVVKPPEDERFDDHLRPPHRRAEWLLDDGRILEFTDIRRFGRIAVVEPGEYESMPTLHGLGPEPFNDEFTPEALRSSIHSSSQAIKTQLMSQRVVAGLGNIYIDEALWDAMIHPRSTRITKAQAELLRDSIRSALQAGIDNGGTTLRDYRDATGATGTNQLTLNCYGLSGEPCPRCGSILKKDTVSGRTTTYCPLCQRRRT